jgi:hypothetical protein
LPAFHLPRLTVAESTGVDGIAQNPRELIAAHAKLLGDVPDLPALPLRIRKLVRPSDESPSIRHDL